MRVVATSQTMLQPGRRSQTRPTRRGYTLLEMIISTGAATVLLGGLMSTIVVANRAWSPDLKPVIKTEASGLTRQLSIDLKSALYFTERTSTAVTFAVPDRDSDGQPELLRYAWSGTVGDPLTVSLNGGTAEPLVADVSTLNLSFLTRSVIAPVIPVSGQNQTIVFITEEEGDSDGSVDLADLPTEDQQRVAAIESWGFTVATLSAEASDTDWNARVGDAAAIYVPGSVESDDLTKRLYYTNVGVVFESSSLRDESGFSTKKDLSTSTDIDLENASHYITSTLSPGSTQIVKSSQPLLALVPGLGPDLEVLARSSSNEYSASLAVLETNGRTRHDDPVPARRVLLPWGDDSTSFEQLTDAALTIMERSITWAAGLDDSPTRRRVLYFVDDATAPHIYDFDRKIMFESAGLEVRLLNQSTDADTLADEIANSSAVYLTIRASTDLLRSAVQNIPQGVMTEGLDWIVPLGFSSGMTKSAAQTLDVVATDHPIMAGITGNSVTVMSSNIQPLIPNGTMANGLTTILELPAKGKGSGAPVVVTIEIGAQRIDDSGSPGRRTLVPQYNTRRSDLTADGYQIFQQAMDWTAAKPDDAAVQSSESSSLERFIRSFAL